MSKLLIDAQTGTILDVSHCYVVDTDTLSEEDLDVLEAEASDSEIAAVAERAGKSLTRIGQDTGWGDNAYSFTVSYSPLSLKDEALSFIEGGLFTEDEREYTMLKWLHEEASTDEIQQVSEWIMTDDNLWSGYRDNFMEALDWVYGNLKGENDE